MNMANGFDATGSGVDAGKFFCHSAVRGGVTGISLLSQIAASP